MKATKRWLVALGVSILLLAAVGFSMSNPRPYRFLDRYQIESERQVDGYTVLKLRGDFGKVSHDAKVEFADRGLPSQNLETYPASCAMDCIFVTTPPAELYVTDDMGAFQKFVLTCNGSGKTTPGYCMVAYSRSENALDRFSMWLGALFESR